MTDLHSDADLKAALARSFEAPIVLFKHSMTCPVSSTAAVQVAGLSGEADPAVFRIVVQRARAVSNDIAAQFGIRHESPQVIVVYRGEALYHTSHFGVRLDRIRSEAQAVV